MKEPKRLSMGWTTKMGTKEPKVKKLDKMDEWLQKHGFLGNYVFRKNFRRFVRKQERVIVNWVYEKIMMTVACGGEHSSFEELWSEHQKHQRGK